MKLTDDWTLVSVSPRRRVLQLAIYAAFLAQGNTIMGLLLKSGTISEYIRQIARFLAVFTNTDPRKHNQADAKLASEIQNVIKEVERWEDVPNKRNPYLPEMHCCLSNLTSSDNPTSLRRSLFRWFGVGISGGFRISEWAQPDTNPHLLSPKLNDRGDPYAFLPSDVVFYSPQGRILSHQQAIILPVHMLGKFSLRHRTQKNNQNGEKRVYTRGSDPRFCAVTNMQHIIGQYYKLVGPQSPNIPLSVFKCESSGAILPITANAITSVLRATAEVAYGLNPMTKTGADKLKLFTSHSIRVGACVILHCKGFTATQIQFLLRWRSDAFMTYLRNTTFLAAQQADAVACSGTMPSIF